MSEQINIRLHITVTQRVRDEAQKLAAANGQRLTEWIRHIILNEIKRAKERPFYTR